jgi:hypothetical protein
MAGSARAYAYVQGGNTPQLVAARSRNVTSVSSPDTGFYCVGLPPSIDANKTAPVVTPVYNTGFADTPVFAQLVDKASVSPDAQCTGNQVEVWSGTLQKNEGGAPQAHPGGTFAFTVAVP